MNIVDYLNSAAFKNMEFIDGSNGIIRMDANQTLHGAVYGNPHDVKVLKQMGNWSENQVDYYLYIMYLM